ncbi:acyltransferase-like protein chloroplastic-like, partial [Trifolium pratense]
MVTVGVSFFPTVFSSIFHRERPYQAVKFNSGRIPSIAPRFAMSIDRVSEEKQKERQSGWKEYLEQAKEFIDADGGLPRWFSPLECGLRLDNSPLMLFLP